jgi:TetR/AcrR family transcriptional regulator, ethionamide resistance regulator
VQIAEIARRAGVTRPGFYFYFPTKAAAVAALLADVAEQLEQASAGWYEGDGDPEPRLREGFHNSVIIWRRHAALFAGMLDAIGTDRDAATLWQQLFDGFVERVARRVEADVGAELRAAGAPSPAHVATALVAMAFAMMERDVRTHLINGKGQPDTEDALVFAYLRLIYGRTT